MKLGDFSSKLKGMSIQQGSVFRMTLFPKDGVTPKNEGDKSRTKYFVVIGKHCCPLKVVDGFKS